MYNEKNMHSMWPRGQGMDRKACLLAYPRALE